MTTEQLLDAVHRLSGEELKRFVQGVIQLEASRREPALSKQQTELLRRINAEPSPAKLSRFRELQKEGRARGLTEQQQAELVQLSDWVEEIHAERMAHVAELARLRGVGLSDVLQQLGIEHWAD
jgi:hypothetical protein